MREVNYEEYLALKKRVEELERQQPKEGALTSGWGYAVTELPIHGYRPYDQYSMSPTVYYERSVNEAWQCFTKLAKQLHAGPAFRLVSRRDAYGRPYKSWWSYEFRKAPRSQAALTYEQKLLSLEMLNELVPIYNKYYKLAHPEAPFFDATGKILDIQIIDENETE